MVYSIFKSRISHCHIDEVPENLYRPFLCSHTISKIANQSRKSTSPTKQQNCSDMESKCILNFCHICLQIDVVHTIVTEFLFSIRFNNDRFLVCVVYSELIDCPRFLFFCFQPRLSNFSVVMKLVGFITATSSGRNCLL